MSYSEFAQTGTAAPLPEDPAAALDLLCAKHGELPPFLRLRVGEVATCDAILERVEGQYPAVVAQAAPHEERAVGALYFMLRETVGPQVIERIGIGRTVTLAAEFCRRVGSAAATEPDPIRVALRPPQTDQSRQVSSRSFTLPQRNAPPAPVTSPKKPAVHSIDDILTMQPGSLLSSMRAAKAAKQINLRGGLDPAYAPIAEALSAEVADSMRHLPVTARGAVDRFLVFMSRYLERRTGQAFAPAVTAERLLPHLQHYLQVAPELRRRHDGPVGRAAAEHRADTLLALEPQKLLAEIRAALVGKQMRLGGTLHRTLLPIQAELAGTVSEQTWYKRANAATIAHHFVLAFSRYVRIGTGYGDPPNISAERLQPHLAYYLEEAATLRNNNILRPYRRALQYSAAEITGLYDYWVRQKGMPKWAFDGVAASSSLDINAQMQSLHEWHGPELPYIRNLAPPYYLPRPIAAGNASGEDSSAPLLDFLEGPENTQPEARMVTYFDLVARFQNPADILCLLPHDDALAVALVYDLPLGKGEDINTPQLAARFRLRARDLQPYVEQQVLPALKDVADELGFDSRNP